MDKNALLETIKFITRLLLLAGVPYLIAHQADLPPFWEDVVGIYLPILLPIIDKYIHEDDRIPAKGVSPI